MTIIHGDAANLVSGGIFNAPVHQDVHYNFYREMLAALALDEATIAWVRDIHVETEAFHEARRVLRENPAVALIGSPGCGRRTAGIVLLADLGVTPKNLVLDLEDLDRPLEILPSHGYLLDLDEDHDQLTPAIGRWLENFAARLRGTGSYLVVRGRQHTWSNLELDEFTLKPISVTAPASDAVFRSHLRGLTSSMIADAWVRNEKIIPLLVSARPSDAVRLARIAHAVRASMLPDEQHVAEAVAAFHNWADALKEWFSRTTGVEHGYVRALALATAALDGASAATIFTATSRLSDLVDLPRTPGGALVGPDLHILVSETKAELRGQTIIFARPAYASSVLDYVWRERPHLHGVLRDWLINIPDPNDRDTERVADSLADLAVRQGEASLVCSAASQWIRKSANLRHLGIQSLTAAALSEQIGREVRRRIYEWAKAGNTSEELHLAVADVCAGPLARGYPQIALTRLRHLAMKPNPAVQSATGQALVSLAGDPTLRHAVLTEISEWMTGREPRQSVGRRAFLMLASPGEDGGIPLLATASERDMDLLAGLWRLTLRQSRQDKTAQRAASAWLEAVAQNRAPRDTVLETLARICHTSIDRATLSEIATDWIRVTEAAAGNQIFVELMDRAWQRDPITVASSRLAQQDS